MDGLFYNGIYLGSIEGAMGTIGPTGPTGSAGSMFPGPTGNVTFLSGSGILNNSNNFNYIDNPTNLTITKPSSQGTNSILLNLISDPSGAHGYGEHLNIGGNISGGGTIFRDDGGANSSFLQVFGCDSSGNNGAQIYLNGNNSSESGDAGGFQCVVGYNNIGNTYGNFQVLGGEPNYNIMFQVIDNNLNGSVQITSLSANSYVGTDAFSNLISITPPASISYYAIASSSTGMLTLGTANTWYTNATNGQFIITPGLLINGFTQSSDTYGLIYNGTNGVNFRINIIYNVSTSTDLTDYYYFGCSVDSSVLTYYNSFKSFGQATNCLIVSNYTTLNNGNIIYPSFNGFSNNSQIITVNSPIIIEIQQI